MKPKNQNSVSMSPLLRVGFGCLFALAMPVLATPTKAQDVLCATVKVQFSNDLVLARTVFTATFGLTNATSSLLEDVNVAFTITDTQGNDAFAVFAIGDPQTAGFLGSAVSSPPTYLLGDVVPASSGSATWVFVPLDEATPLDANETYFIGGTLSYMKNGSPVVLPIFPEEIEVVPNADLSLRFFLQRHVFSNNALTPNVIEPAEPFSLGLLIENLGGGTANSVSIETQMPTIIENTLGLPISFDILAVQSSFDPLLPASEIVQLGDVEPGGVRVVRWVVVSSFEGDFSPPVAAFQYTTALGVPEVPLIDVEDDVPGLVHMVDLGEDPLLDDGLPDFLLTDDVPPPGIDPTTNKPFEDVPVEYWASSGEIMPVTVRLHQESIVGTLSEMNLVATLQVNYPSAGWFYVRVNDVGGSSQGLRAFDLVQATRFDSGGGRTSLNVGGPGDISNVWTTARVFDDGNDPDLIPDGTQYLVHLLEFIPAAGVYDYDLVYVPAPDFALTADVDVISISTGTEQRQILTLNGGLANAGKQYLVVGTTSGTTPGVLITGVPVPINIDSYTRLLLTPFFMNAFQLFGTFDPLGAGRAEIVIPPDLPASDWLGVQFDYAYVVIDPSTGIVIGSSNPVNLILTF